MTFNEYQKLAMRTASNRTNDSWMTQFDTGVLGLNGEAGEIADDWKKFKYHGHDFDRDRMIKELGDVLWYVACATSGIAATMEEIAIGNIEKLKKRYPEGFDTDRSMNRSDGDS